MKRSISCISAAAAVVIWLCGVAVADINFTIAPSDLVEPTAFFLPGAPSTGFGWDWDEGRPIGADSPGAGAPGYGPTSFYSDVEGSAGGGGRDYTALRLSPEKIFGGVVTLGDLGDLSYWTSWVSGLDWQIKIYTKPGSSGWYGHRFNFERPDPATADWTNYGTSGNGALNVNWIRSGSSGDDTYPNAPLSTLISTYGAEEIMWIDIISSYMTNSPGSLTYLDGVEMTVDGQAAYVNLVPAPGAALLGVLGLGLIGRIKRRFA